MRYIVRGGITSRNIPANSMDAIKLAMSSPRLSGIYFNVFQTKDQEIVVYNGPTVDNGKEKINELTLHNLERRNFGTNIRKHSIVRLEDALRALKNTNGIIIVSLGNKKDLLFIRKVLAITKKYPDLNIYLESADQEILLYLKDATKKERVGAIITSQDSELWDMDLDFYSLFKTQLNLWRINEKISKYKRIMIHDIKENRDCKKMEELFSSNNAVYLIIDSIHVVF